MHTHHTNTSTLCHTHTHSHTHLQIHNAHMYMYTRTYQDTLNKCTIHTYITQTHKHIPADTHTHVHTYTHSHTNTHPSRRYTTHMYTHIYIHTQQFLGGCGPWPAEGGQSTKKKTLVELYTCRHCLFSDQAPSVQ